MMRKRFSIPMQIASVDIVVGFGSHPNGCIGDLSRLRIMPRIFRNSLAQT